MINPTRNQRIPHLQEKDMPVALRVYKETAGAAGHRKKVKNSKASCFTLLR